MVVMALSDHAWLVIGATAIGGFSMGVGLVTGAFVARMLRHYMKDEGLNGKS